jgi:hypothetical protein
VALAITLIAVFVLCILPAVGGGIVYLANRSKAEPSATATSHPTQPRASHEPARKPVAGDTEAVYRNWMTDRITDALAARDKALVAGDEAGYAAAVDPAKTSTESRLQHQYASLRALSVQGVQSQVDGQLVHKSGKDFDSIWEAEISIRPCFGAATCDESTTHRKEVWRLIDGQARVQDVAISTRASKGPRPWEASDLRATMGNRTIVATTSKYASSLPNLSVQAEKAAIIADRLAYRKAPAKYVIYYAGPNEWKTWFSWNPPQWAGGASLELGPVHSELVLNAAELTKSFLNNILQHELTHASTIPGATGDSADWWMVEGIAEYAEMDGSPARLYVGLPLVKQMVKNGWDGDIDVDAPRDADADTDVGAKYGIAFLAIRSLAERYGEDKMVQFFMDVVHNGKTKDAASQAAFGKSWSSISSECAQFVHSTVGA